MKPAASEFKRFAEANDIFLAKAESAFSELIEKARATNELHFAFSLNPEVRGIQDPGWSTSREAEIAFKQYNDFVNQGKRTPLKVRVAIAFYCHLAEASGFYEVPKNLLRVASGQPYVLWPFNNLVEQHRVTGELIAPNSNRVFRDLVGHAKTLGLDTLAEVFRDAFDSDLRNGYSHADYVIWDDGIHLPKRNGGTKTIISWPDFTGRWQRGLRFYDLLRRQVARAIKSYDPPRQLVARLSDEPERTWTIAYDSTQRSFSIHG